MFIPSASSKKTLAPAQTPPVVEIVDASNRSLGALPLDEVLRQKLFCRMVLVLLYDQHGKLYLVKFPEWKEGGVLAPCRWDIGLVTYVRPGESTKDGALRRMRENLGTRAGRLHLVRTWPVSWDAEKVFVSLYRLYTHSSSLQYMHQKNETLAVDQEELEGLVIHCPDLLTNRVISLDKQAQLFPIL